MPITTKLYQAECQEGRPEPGVAPAQALEVLDPPSRRSIPNPRIPLNDYQLI